MQVATINAPPGLGIVQRTACRHASWNLAQEIGALTGAEGLGRYRRFGQLKSDVRYRACPRYARALKLPRSLVHICPMRVPPRCSRTQTCVHTHSACTHAHPQTHGDILRAISKSQHPAHVRAISAHVRLHRRMGVHMHAGATRCCLETRRLHGCAAPPATGKADHITQTAPRPFGMMASS